MAVNQFLLGAGVVFTLSYLLGSIPFGFLIGKYNGIDIRKYGSHNIGATNVTRVLGTGCGRLCFGLDFLKGLLAVYIFGVWVGNGNAIEAVRVAGGWGGIIAGGGAIIGHMYPVWFAFKGGKGVSTSIGALAALAFWPLIVALISWWLVFRRTKIVSAASLTMAAVAPITGVILRLTGLRNISWPNIGVMFVIGVMIFVRHWENIIRLIQGKENSFKK